MSKGKKTAAVSEYARELASEHIFFEGQESYDTTFRKLKFHHKNIWLFQGNSLNENLFDKEFIDLIITSPPYNVGIEYNSNNDVLTYESYLEFSRTWIKNCYIWSRPEARFLLNIPLDKNKGGHHSVGADLTRIAQEVGWKYHATIIWNEGNISRRTAWGSWLSASAPYVIAPVELIVVLYKDKWKKTLGTKESNITKEEFMAWTNGVWTFNGESRKRIGHPAPFPRELPYRCIRLFSFVNDVVFDPFCGSGTTLIEAYNNKRRAVGVELDEKYCSLAAERVSSQIKLFD
ncbi:MAG: methyltransferase [Chloroflexota bacterium]|nr:MAG: methyltransferase [Chloroflexota bacterium]